MQDNVGPITCRAGAERRPTTENYTAGPVRCIGGLSSTLDGGESTNANRQFLRCAIRPAAGRRIFCLHFVRYLL